MEGPGSVSWTHAPLRNCTIGVKLALLVQLKPSNTTGLGRDFTVALSMVVFRSFFASFSTESWWRALKEGDSTPEARWIALAELQLLGAAEALDAIVVVVDLTELVPSDWQLAALEVIDLVDPLLVGVQPSRLRCGAAECAEVARSAVHRHLLAELHKGGVGLQQAALRLRRDLSSQQVARSTKGFLNIGIRHMVRAQLTHVGGQTIQCPGTHSIA